MNNFASLYNIVHPTSLQAERLSNGEYRVSVAAERGHRYITLADYIEHHDAGAITIHTVSDPNAFGIVTVWYTVN